jgi:hypothetical protein
MENGKLKVCILDSNNSPKHLLVFGSGREESLFSNIETEFYAAQNTNIIYTDSRIYLDDTIQTTNHKIWSACNKDDNIPKFCLEEMYLFGVVENPFQLLPWYKEVTNYEKEEVTNKTIAKLLTNYYMDQELVVDLLFKTESFQNDSDPEISFEDLENSDWFREKTKWEKMGLGFEFLFPTPPNLRNRDAYFCVNPLETKLFSTLHEPTGEQIQQQNHFLFHKGTFKDNTIFLCLAEFTLDYWTRENVAYDKLMERYYPGIPKDFWSTGRDTLLEKNRTTVSQPHLFLQNKYIDAILDMQKETEIEYLSKGIKSFYFIKHPYETKNLPILTIFKRITTTIDVPMIQFSSPNKENSISRIHTRQKTHEGIKIPLLNRIMTNDINLKELKQGSREERLVLFIKYDNTNPNDLTPNDLIRLSLEKNGNIHIHGNLQKFIDLQIFETWINKLLEPAINLLNEVVIPLGYRIEPFEKIDHPYVETVFVNFGCELNLIQVLDISKVTDCLSSIFIQRIEKQKQRKQKGGMEMIYWRVENYEKLTDEDVYISQQLRLHYNRVFKRQQIITELASQFPGKDPELLLTAYEGRQGQRITPSRYTNQNNSQKTNSGFLTTISRISNFSYKYRVEVQFIHNMSYLKTVPIFIDSMLKMILKPTDAIQTLCSSGTKVAVEKFEVVNNMPLMETVPEILLEPEDSIKSNVSDEESEEDDDDDKSFKNEDQEEEEDDEQDVEVLVYDDQEEEEEEFGGGKKKNDVKEWTPLQYFMARIEKRDSKLYDILHKNHYARKSQNDKPVILTEDEKNEVDRLISDKTKDYGPKQQYESVKYRKDKDGKYLHYICPRYWCSKPNLEGPLTEEEAKSGICGNIITDKAKRKPDEFVLKNDINGNGKLYVGFLNSNKKNRIVDEENNPICFPQCMEKNAPNILKMKAECNPDVYATSKTSTTKKGKKEPKKKGKVEEDIEEDEDEDEDEDDDDDDEEEDEDEDEEEDAKQKEPVQKKGETNEVKVEINKNKLRTLIDLPVSDDRMGRLPPAIQVFLNSKYTANTLVSGGEKVLLRFGLTLTKNNKHSFLACLADIYSLLQPKKVDVDAFREVLVKKVTLDAFVSLHNGSIASIFQPITERNINIDNYKNTELYKYINTTEESQLKFLKSSIASLENFHAYLLDKDNVIEPTYLWEIISGKLLFSDGYNMIIVEHFANNNQVGIQCPNNPYINNIFHPRKKTFILLKEDDTYTPLYLIRAEEQLATRVDAKNISFYLTKVFSKNESPNMKALLEMFERNINKFCSPQNTVITFKKSLNATSTVSLLNSFPESLQIVAAVWNYQGKIIGFTVKWTKNNETEIVDGKKIMDGKSTFFLPCFPSTVAKRFYPVKWMDDNSIWKDYKSTIEFLNHIQKIGDDLKVNNNSKPLMKVIEDGYVIGIVTSSHNFIQINPKVKTSDIDKSDTLEELIQSNPFDSDKNIALNKPTATQNKNNKLLWLQQQFYTLFRNKIRILLNTFSKTRNVRKEIITFVNQKRTSSKDKAEAILEKLKQIGKSHFSFSPYTDDELMKLNKISLCDGSCEKNPYCIKNEAGVCVLKIPSNNLVTNESNELMYTRLTEELMNNKTSFNFMLFNNFYLDFDTQDYVQINDEVILPFSKMNSKYFRSLVPKKDSSYVHKNNYQTTGRSTVDVALDWKSQFTGTAK